MRSREMSAVGRAVGLAVAFAVLMAVPAQAAATRWIYWANLNADTISRAKLDGTGGATIVTGQQRPRGVAIDEKNGWIFWANNNDDTIGRARLDGSQATTIDTTGASIVEPSGVAVDPAAGRVYWASSFSNRISYANEDGSGGGGTLPTTGANVNNPQGVAIDKAAGRLYFSNDLNTAHGSIGYLRLDGTGGGNLNTSPSGPEGFSEGVSVNPTDGRVYWGAYNSGGPEAIGVTKTDGTAAGAALDTTGATVSGPSGTAYDAATDRVYWTNYANSTISYAGAAGGSGGTLAVAGSGIASPWGSPALSSGGTPSVTVTPVGGLDFGEQRTGTTASGRTITLANSGTVAALLDNLGIGGTDAARFGKTTTCGATLPAGGSCTVTVTFSPAADGAAAASLDVDVDGTTVHRALAGTGVTPVADLAPVSKAFGEQRVGNGPTAAQTFTVRNTGTGTLGLTGIALGGANPGQFSISGGTCTSSTDLVAGASCTVTVVFDPSSVGAKAASLDITTDAGNVSSTLSGTGVDPAVSVSPPTRDFGTENVGGELTAPVTFTVGNAGTGTLRLSTAAIAGANPGDFPRQGGTCTDGQTLAAGASCTVQISFVPTAAGARAATLAVTTDAGSASAALTGTGVIPPLTLSDVTVTPRCMGTGSGAAPDLRIDYTLSDPARVTFTVQRRTAPGLVTPRLCPYPLTMTGRDVSYADVDSGTSASAGGSGYATVQRTGSVTGGTLARTARARPLARTVSAARGRTRTSLRRALHASGDLPPGRYRVLVQAERADGVRSLTAVVRFWVLRPPRR